MRTLTLALFTTSLLALPACNGGKGGEESTGDTDETSTTTNTGVDPTTTTNASSTTEPETSTTNGTATGNSSTTSDPTTTGGPVTSTTLEPETSTTFEPGTTGEPGECAGLNGMACMANEACMPIGGGKLNLAKMCVGKPTFLSCEPAAGCGDALTYGCDPAVEPPEPFLFPSTCLPAGWAVCDAPMIDQPCK